MSLTPVFIATQTEFATNGYENYAVHGSGSNLWCVLTNSLAATPHHTLYRSTDSGATWAAASTWNVSTNVNGYGFYVSTNSSNGVLWSLYASTSDTYAAAKLDLATGTVTQYVSGIALSTNSLFMDGGVHIVTRSDGSAVVVGTSSLSGRIWRAIVSSSGSWGSFTQISRGSLLNCSIRTAVLGGSDLVHVVVNASLSGTFGFYHTSVDTSNAASTVALIYTNANVKVQSPRIAYLSASNQLLFVSPEADPSTFAPLSTVAYATSAATPTWTLPGSPPAFNQFSFAVGFGSSAEVLELVSTYPNYTLNTYQWSGSSFGAAVNVWTYTVTGATGTPAHVDSAVMANVGGSQGFSIRDTQDFYFLFASSGPGPSARYYAM